MAHLLPVLNNRFLLFLLAGLACFFSTCSVKNNSPQNTFGDLDTAGIASDTAMQVGMELSYEYQKSLVQNDSTVFDFLAYDKPKGKTGTEWESKFHIIRRTGHSGDTIAKGPRSGTVRSIWLSDLDHNGQEEIMFYEYPKTSKGRVAMIAYEMGAGHKAHPIQIDLKEDIQHYRGRDTFFVYQQRLVRRYPYYVRAQDSIAAGSEWQSYKLSNGKLLLDKEWVGNTLLVEDFKYRVKWCPVCNQGWVTIVKDIATKKLYLCCSECECEWGNPNEILRGKGTRGKYGQCTRPYSKEIREKHWDNYLIEKNSDSTQMLASPEWSI